jgi:hypothetical protein
MAGGIADIPMEPGIGAQVAGGKVELIAGLGVRDELAFQSAAGTTWLVPSTVVMMGGTPGAVKLP